MTRDVYCPDYDATMLAVRTEAAAKAELKNRLQRAKRYRDGMDNQTFRVKPVATAIVGVFVFDVECEGTSERFVVKPNRTIKREQS